MKKVKHIFSDGESNCVYLYLGNKVCGIGIIEGDSCNLYEKNKTGGADKVNYKEYKEKIIEYFINNDFELIENLS